MKTFLYFIVLLLAIPAFLGAKMITILKAQQLIYDKDSSVDSDLDDISWIHIDFKPTREVIVDIPIIKDTIIEGSPYATNIYFHNNSQDMEIEKLYFLIDAKKRVEIDREFESVEKRESTFTFKIKEMDLDIDKQVEFIAKYRVDRESFYVKYIYKIKHTEETGNRLWWAIMSV